MRKLLAFPFAALAAVCWMIADFLWDVRNPRHEYNISELSPEARRVIANLEALQKAAPPVYTPASDDEDTQPMTPLTNDWFRATDPLDLREGRDWRLME